MKLAIVGSRGFHDYELLKTEVNKFLQENNFQVDTIVSGGAKGADRMAEIYAAEKRLITYIILPNWDLHGKKAGYLRNIEIVDKADAVIAFWDGKSAGTNHSINISKEKNKPLKVVYYV